MQNSQIRRWGTWGCWLLLITATLLQAADVVKKPAKVTIVKNDKTSVLGEFVEASPSGVTVKPAKGDPTMVAWSEIKTVSNGLTHQKVVDDWKSAKAELLCDTCHGDGTEKCETCKGTGVDPANAKPCEKCKGTGDLGNCPKCKEGKIPCPATCIKRSDFRGEKDDAGVPRSRVFRHPKGGGGLWVHEPHIGELLVAENGYWTLKGKCPTCGGTTEVICPTCHGTAKRECPTCHGAGATGPACTAGCHAGEVECKICHGSGLKQSTPPAAG